MPRTSAPAGEPLPGSGGQAGIPTRIHPPPAPLGGRQRDAEAPAFAPPRLDHPEIEQAVRHLLVAIGEDPDRPGLLGTPSRVARMYGEIFSGVGSDPADEIDVMFTSSYDELILVRDIPLYSICEHHLMPFVGRAHVGYVPNGRGQITGLSKLARVVEVAARRLQVQERLTVEIADALSSRLKPAGMIVVLEAEHLCMAMRGVRKPGAVTLTSALRGVLRDDPAARDRAMGLVCGS